MVSGIFGKTPAIRQSGFFLILVAVLFLALPAVAYAEEIIYTGDKNKLQEVPSWFFNESSPLFDEPSPSLFPGTTGAPLSSGNKITVNYNQTDAGVTNPGRVFGGLSKTGKVPNNSVVLLKGQIDSDIYGGFSAGGKVTGNAVTISSCSVGRGVFGGYSKKGDVTDNSITFSEGAVASGLVGGCSQTKKVAGNSVVLLDGHVKSEICGGFGGTGSVTDNSVTISGGFVGMVTGGESTKGRVSGNIVTISGGSVEEQVYGGCSDSVVADNSVIISGGSAGGAVYGGCSYKSDTTGNSVTISGGSVEVSVYGGICTSSGHANSMGNTVIIGGGAVGRGVFGGLSSHGNATGNTVTISGRPDLARAYIWGGNTEDGDAFTGNILHFKSSGISAEGVNNFEYYNFYLPEDLAADGIMLSVTEAVDLKGTTVAIFLQDGTELREGDKIALIHSAACVSNAPKNKSCQVKHGGVRYVFSIYTDENNLWAKVETVSGVAK